MKRALAYVTFVALAVICCGSAVTGTGLGSFQASTLKPPAALTSIAMSLSQSNGTGRAESPYSGALSTTPSATDLQLIDFGTCIDAGTCFACVAGQSCYDDAGSPTLQLQPYVNPIHRQFGVGTSTPPNNDWGGESQGAGFFNQVHSEASGFVFSYTDDAVSGACLSAINVGSATWNYLLFEITAMRNRAPDAGFPTYFVGAIPEEHGECDCQNNLYGSQLVTAQANLQSALLAITGNRPGPGRCPTCIPLLLMQQNSQCGNLGPNYASTEQLTIAQDPANVGHILGVGPTYWLPFSSGMIHRRNIGHREEAALEGEAYIAYEQWQQNGAAWPLPVAPIKVGAFTAAIQSAPDPATFVRSGNVVTINFSVPVGESLVTDSTGYPTLHQTGPFAAYWSGGLGFEGWTGVTTRDGGMPGVQFPSFEQGQPISTTCAITGAAQAQCTFSQPPDLIAYATTPDDNSLLDGGAYDGGGAGWVGPPNGTGGWLRTNYSKVDSFGDPLPIQHWTWAFIQGGPF